jgi:hypothetical protein
LSLPVSIRKLPSPVRTLSSTNPRIHPLTLSFRRSIRYCIRKKRA